MPMTVQCERGHAFQVEERQIGDRALCPHCGWEMIVPDPRDREQMRVEEDELVEVEVEEGRPRKRKSNQRLQRIDLGLQFHWLKIVCLLTGVAVWMLLTVTSPMRDQIDPIMDLIIRVVGVLTIIGLFLVAPILGIIGSLLCCFVPKRTGTRSLIVASLVLDVVPFLLSLLGLLLVLFGTVGLFRREGAFDLAIILQVLALMLLVAAWVVFMLFLRKLADYLDEGGQHDEALVVVVEGVILVLAPGLVFGPAALGQGQLWATLLFIVGALGMVFWLYAVVRLLFRVLTVIGHMRDVIRADGGLVVPGKTERRPPVPTPGEWSQASSLK